MGPGRCALILVVRSGFDFEAKFFVLPSLGVDASVPFPPSLGL